MPDRATLASNVASYCQASPKRLAVLKAVRKPGNYIEVAQTITADPTYCSNTLNHLRALGAIEELPDRKGYFRQTDLMKTIDIPSEVRDSGKRPTSPKPHDSEIIRETVRVFDIEQGLDLLDLDPEIIHDCFPLRKPFRIRAGEAYLTLENVIRRELALPDSVFGAQVVAAANARGVFKRTVPSESEGLVQLFNSAFLWYRNSYHHKKEDISKQDALKVIMHADYLIKVFRKQCGNNGLSRQMM